MSDISKILFIIAGMLWVWQGFVFAIAWGEVKDATRMRKRGLPYPSKVTFTAAPLFLGLVAALIGALVS